MIVLLNLGYIDTKYNKSNFKIKNYSNQSKEYCNVQILSLFVRTFIYFKLVFSRLTLFLLNTCYRIITSLNAAEHLIMQVTGNYWKSRFQLTLVESQTSFP